MPASEAMKTMWPERFFAKWGSSSRAIMIGDSRLTRSARATS